MAFSKHNKEEKPQTAASLKKQNNKEQTQAAVNMEMK